ncbi:transcriptional regulator [Deinococcus cellulosilyticus NBRC 106333 = KACC 11606]|uniref:Transcriptional regulator n=2 Tax=Deinococcus cellulosilyticus TaxID=401558 RepID=A0A511N056_DEIC1|nr:transcriptional regulator [Deinococcus cellulosilyticus NBRC 106333 = KACC 11606]
MASAQGVGTLLREWRQRRRLSQMDLALEADISTRHLSFVETGRSHPSREMVLHLATHLNVPLREQNLLLTAAGYAPVFPERSLQDPSLQAARQALDLILQGHEPYPALLVDRHWNLQAMNRAIPPLLEGLPEHLLQAPVNVLRLSLHPEGLAPGIENLAEWRAHLLERLKRQVDLTADPVLMDLLAELQAYPAPRGIRAQVTSDIAIPLRLRTSQGVLSFLSTTTVFGTPVEVTLSELALETFFPADAFTLQVLQGQTV